LIPAVQNAGGIEASGVDGVAPPEFVAIEANWFQGLKPPAVGGVSPSGIGDGACDGWKTPTSTMVDLADPALPAPRDHDDNRRRMGFGVAHQRFVARDGCRHRESLRIRHSSAAGLHQ